jgi:hypothetical protein
MGQDRQATRKGTKMSLIYGKHNDTSAFGAKVGGFFADLLMTGLLLAPRPVNPDRDAMLRNSLPAADRAARVKWVLTGHTWGDWRLDKVLSYLLLIR